MFSSGLRLRSSNGKYYKVCASARLSVSKVAPVVVVVVVVRIHVWALRNLEWKDNM